MKNLCSADDELWRVVELISWRWACLFKFPLVSVEPYPAHGTSSCWGWCDTDTGRMAIALRFSSGGRWNKQPESSLQILDTIAHELAHFSHGAHGKPHKRLMNEILDDMIQEGCLQWLNDARYFAPLDKAGRRVVT